MALVADSLHHSIRRAPIHGDPEARTTSHGELQIMRKRLASYLSHGVLAGTVLQGATALALVMTPTLAGAQARMDALEEITVTATRREAGLQTIGVSVTALSADALRDMNVTRTDDLAMVTPGLSLIQAGGAPVAGLIAIRGVAQNDFAPHL